MITIEDIQKLRQATQAPIMECKKALEEAKGDEEKAKEILRKQGAIRAQSKQDKETKSGIIESYVHSNKKVGTLVELRCETDSVAANAGFSELAHDIAMQIAATNALYLSPEQIPSEVLSQQTKDFQEEVPDDKPEEIKKKIIDGKLDKWFQEVCLENQAFIKDDTRTIKDLIQEASSKFGEKVEIGQFVRFQI